MPDIYGNLTSQELAFYRQYMNQYQQPSTYQQYPVQQSIPSLKMLPADQAQQYLMQRFARQGQPDNTNNLVPADMPVYTKQNNTIMSQQPNNTNDILRQFQKKNYGTRIDGTPKGTGWLGELKTSNGDIATELSIGVNFDGKDYLIPSLVPTLTKEEVQYLLQGNSPTDEIIQKAIDHAIKLIQQGKSPFKE